MPFTVHTLHAPSTELIDGGYQIRPGLTIKLGEPLATFEKMEDAEEWRLGRLSLVKRQSAVVNTV